MKIAIHVKPNSKQEKVERIDPTHFKIWVGERPVDGKANEAVVRVLAKHLDVPKSSIKLLRGNSSRTKVFELLAKNIPW